MTNLSRVDKLIKGVENSIKNPRKVSKDEKLYVGVDLGTAYIVVVVLDSEKRPVACEMQFAQVVRDGLVVDFLGATNIVKELKRKIEDKLGVELTKASIAVPPGTGERDIKTHVYVVEGAGIEVVSVEDEPTAANAVLQIENGVVVDVGGGTTGLSIFKNGKVIYTADEATGGTQLSLVVAGAYKIPFEEAEEKKKHSKNQEEIFHVVKPVIQKIASIIKTHIKGFDVEKIYLVGGTCCLKEFEDVIQKETGIETIKPLNPFLVTPLGISMNCVDNERS
ncbi:ethanolamine utilization protein EutJ [Clostridium tetani]|uniref:Ethanolamine utilization protein eutJ n=1 Tax=Clostridium tetani (strain Massachusetts / E88) TaxID=212717 RepID=Q892D6_CLOTE|nr:ethanolamine utilization protein EutJ [Clostridium tetani]AAO36659.1 ethanolamine utilization protein eutJ [Clostridium tetani E88]AVP54049.1 ethanolamine utilization protein EutJ [Clostridium tetani]KGI39331.1 ethanolamine utilization protein EutJ [Clostridium tetani ATCC 9441]KGI41047.1 ethanolamine utilization protein EutJ [Clostridium tetani]KGI45266.1 ethanolamine utilization protein EutJ [Clostridium tetani]